MRDFDDYEACTGPGPRKNGETAPKNKNNQTLATVVFQIEALAWGKKTYEKWKKRKTTSLAVERTNKSNIKQGQMEKTHSHIHRKKRADGHNSKRTSI